MTGAALVAVPGMALVAVAPTLAWFYAGWVVVGVAWPERSTRLRSRRSPGGAASAGSGH